MTAYQVDPQALKATAEGINHAVEELKSVTSAVSAEVGHGFEDLRLAMAEVGDPHLQGAFEVFCERWSWGIRDVVQEGSAIAEKLHMSAGLYHDQEQYVANTAKDLVSAVLGGNPNLDEKQVENSSWHQVLSDNAVNDVRHADYSAASFRQSMVHQASADAAAVADLADGPWAKAGVIATGDLAAPQVEQIARLQKDRAEQLEELSKHLGGGR